MCEKYFVQNPSRCACEIDKYLKSIIGGSVVICDEIIEVRKTILTKTFPRKTISTIFDEKR